MKMFKRFCFFILLGALAPGAAAAAESESPLSPRAGEALIRTGSGVAVNDAALVSNRHVAAGCSRIAAGNDRQIAQSADIALSPGADLALVRFPPATFRDYARLAASAPQKGDRLYAIGYPDGLERGWHSKYTEGVFSADIEQSSAFLQTVPLFPGSSGSGVYNRMGSLAGINTATDKDMQGMSYALNLKTVSAFLRQAGARFTESWWGNSVQDNENSTFMIFCFAPQAQAETAASAPRESAPPPAQAQQTQAAQIDVYCNLRLRYGEPDGWQPFAGGKTYRRHYRIYASDMLFMVISPYSGRIFPYNIDKFDSLANGVRFSTHNGQKMRDFFIANGGASVLEDNHDGGGALWGECGPQYQ